MSFFSPLEQFEVVLVKPIILRLTDSIYLDLSISNSAIVMFSAASLLLFCLLNFQVKLVPTRSQSFAENMYIFVCDIVRQQGGRRAIKYFPFYFVIFYFIFFNNLLGMVPFSFTPTSHIINTLTMGLMIFMGVMIVGIMTKGVKWLLIFVPKNVPGWLLPLLVLIETFSYFIRPFSLSIRLFANMLAGHTLLHILASFTLSLLKFKVILGLILGVIVLAIVVLEFGIAFLQSYVFVVLCAIYMNESLYDAH